MANLPQFDWRQKHSGMEKSGCKRLVGKTNRLHLV